MKKSLWTITGMVVGGLILGAVIGYGVFWKWGMCRRWVPYGQSMLMTRKTGEPSPRDSYAGEGEQGVLKEMRGPGRYLDVNPWKYSTELVDNIYVPPGKMLLLKSNVGKDLPDGRFLANPGEKGTLRKVRTPGTWRVNTYGMQVVRTPSGQELWDAPIIPPGYVGVQTLQESSDGDRKGVQPEVLQPGYYNINPKRMEIDQKEIGFVVLTMETEFKPDKIQKGDGQKQVKIPVEGTGVSFPLRDGNQMFLDFTVVWGITPENAPHILSKYGSNDMVEDKVIKPQVTSICKNLGSDLSTKEFIEGATREKFQQEVTDELKEMGEKKGIEVLIALVRGFHPDIHIREQIQARMLAEEEKETLAIEQKRDTVAARLEKARKMVDIAIKDFKAETSALVESEREKGLKKAASFKAQADRQVAGLEKQTAEVKAKAKKIVGQASADVVEAKKKAEAKELQLKIAAFGGPESYNKAQWAELLSDDLTIEYRYSGPGTFWTDAESGFQGLAAKQILREAAQDQSGDDAGQKKFKDTSNDE
ncbi:MAG: hypothetical protein KGZ25_00350 [Planctomycetes bacterium]|nr:hypothetical protein [Planctomycetota bacterium]